MRLLLAGGGTGGHLFPAVALAQTLLRQDTGNKVQFVGTKKGLETTLLPRLGLPLLTVDMAGVVGRGLKGKLEMVPRLCKSMVQAKVILKGFQPDFVIGVGGYSSVPVLLVAKLLGIPYAIHEQNAFPGLSNKLLSQWAARIFLSYPESGNAFDQRKVRVTGNPLRAGLEKIAEQVPKSGKLLIFGGSRGARAINQAVIELLPLLGEWGQVPEILHQTGSEDYEEVQQAYAAAGFDPQQVVSFIDDMATAYAEAKLVVCRAGATTLAEITTCGRPAILIPYPYAAADHQTANADTLAKARAAKLLPQDELTAEKLNETIKGLFDEQKQLQQMAENARSLAKLGAAEKILNECRQVLGTPQVEVN